MNAMDVALICKALGDANLWERTFRFELCSFQYA